MSYIIIADVRVISVDAMKRQVTVSSVNELLATVGERGVFIQGMSASALVHLLSGGGTVHKIEMIAEGRDQ